MSVQSIVAEDRLPQDWSRRVLRDVTVKIQDGTHFSPTLGGTDYKYITSRNIGPGYLRLDSVETISTEEHRRIYRRCDVRYGDLLLTKDGANTGNAALSSFREEVSLLSSVAFIRADHHQAVESYLLQYLLSLQGRKQIADAMAGNAITRLTLAKINNLAVPLPPIDEQREIASVLATLDGQVGMLKRLISKKEAIKQGMAQQLLTRKTRLPGFTEPWVERVLGDIASVDPEPLGSATSVDAIIDYISLEDVSRGVLLRTSRIRLGDAPSRARRCVRELDVLFGTVRPNLQSHLIYTGGLLRPVASTGFAVVRAHPGLADPRFIFRLLMSGLTGVQMDRIIAGSNYPAVSSNDVRRLRFGCPDVAEQAAIGTLLTDCDEDIQMLRVRLAKVEAIKRGMMQELLTGRTRLPIKETAAA